MHCRFGNDDEALEHLRAVLELVLLLRPAPLAHRCQDPMHSKAGAELARITALAKDSAAADDVASQLLETPVKPVLRCACTCAALPLTARSGHAGGL